MAVGFAGQSSQSEPESVIRDFGCRAGDWVVVAILQELLGPLGRCMGLLRDRLEARAQGSMTVLTAKVGREGNSPLSVSRQPSALTVINGVYVHALFRHFVPPTSLQIRCVFAESEPAWLQMCVQKSRCKVALHSLCSIFVTLRLELARSVRPYQDTTSLLGTCCLIRVEDSIPSSTAAGDSDSLDGQTRW